MKWWYLDLMLLKIKISEMLETQSFLDSYIINIY
jgi:hypothetical protein